MKPIVNLFILSLLLVGCKEESSQYENTEVAIVESNQEKELEILDFESFKPMLEREDEKVYVVNFWATWCAPCVKELPYFEMLNENYKDKNVEVVLVSLDFPKQYDKKLKPFIKERDLQSKIIALNDVDFNSWIEQVNKDWSGAIPATLIYTKDKRKFYESSFEWEELESELKTFL